MRLAGPATHWSVLSESLVCAGGPPTVEPQLARWTAGREQLEVSAGRTFGHAYRGCGRPDQTTLVQRPEGLDSQALNKIPLRNSIMYVQ